MPTYVYSPVQSKNSRKSSRSNASSAASSNVESIYKKNSRTSPKSLLNMYSNNNKNISGTLKYQTTAPSIVGKKYTQRPNGGYNLSYHLKNASIKTSTKPKLKFIQVAKLVSPKLLK